MKSAEEIIKYLKARAVYFSSEDTGLSKDCLRHMRNELAFARMFAEDMLLDPNSPSQKTHEADES